MAKTITDISHTVRPAAPATFTNVAVVTIECPISELAALLALAGLTNAIPSAVTVPIVALGNSGGR